ncbi:uncharacterized protein NECHADRAFT_81292 [Fusarium vanettenii 77-13-4]|uniref:Uncharacterized protein n=1 Tax=Fusarium vanettenii (strain ATCC MYA-4622 / CBS 123669 / FGSC 9596 / NRRL 45880 / 77-13-4) TaxID=660122 RepID=C7ZHT3_FUSV7|nr:uncharacterized protein NECHADRAFT_81292 [Fusarium vanettenii 77-13-4]EEU36568.1 predicted protein [Fusarium vanettenii 77-13-4]
MSRKGVLYFRPYLALRLTTPTAHENISKLEDVGRDVALPGVPFLAQSLRPVPAACAQNCLPLPWPHSTLKNLTPWNDSAAENDLRWLGSKCEAGRFSEDSNKHAQTDNGTRQTASNPSVNFQAYTGHNSARLQLLRSQQIPNVLCGVPIDRAPPFGTGPPQAEALFSLKRAVANSAHLPPRTSSDKSPSHLPNILSFLFSPPSTAACNSLLFGYGLPAVPRQTSRRTSPRRPPFLRREIWVFNKGPAPVVLCPWEGRGRALPPSGGAASSPSFHWCWLWDNSNVFLFD